jgi:hypothetical protein
VITFSFPSRCVWTRARRGSPREDVHALEPLGQSRNVALVGAAPAAEAARA